MPDVWVSDFAPSKNGFLFKDNSFASTSGPFMSVCGVNLYAQDGICDGFVFTVLDLYYSNPRLFPPPDTTAPAQGTSLFNYLTHREVDAFTSDGNNNYNKAVDWIQASSKTLSSRTCNEWNNHVKPEIDNNHPSPIWVVTEPQTNDFVKILKDDLPKHHMLLAYGYTLGPKGLVTLNIYDPQVDSGMDSVSMSFTLNSSNIALNIPSMNSWAPIQRGFFRPDYVQASPAAMFPKKGAHLYTTSASERDSACKNYGYSLEGIACYVYPTPAKGMTGLLRLRSSTDHFYTTNAAESDNAVRNYGYVLEGTCCYVYGNQGSADRVPFYRLLGTGSYGHLYTTSASERTNAISNYGYTDEGVACYVYNHPASGSVPLFRLVK